MDIDRTKRIKEARDEAKKEIDTYRKTKEAEFKKFESEVCLRSPNERRLICSARHLVVSMPHQLYNLLDRSSMAGIVKLTRSLAHEWKQAGRRGCKQGG